MTTIAQQVRAALAGAQTFTLYGGYALDAGRRIQFPTGVQELEKRNDKGQVRLARYRYADNSTLTYTRKPDNQFTLKATQ